MLAFATAPATLDALRAVALEMAARALGQLFRLLARAEHTNQVFVCFFISEMLLKMYAVGLKLYMVSSFNRFDFAVCTLLSRFLRALALCSLLFSSSLFVYDVVPQQNEFVCSLNLIPRW